MGVIRRTYTLLRGDFFAFRFVLDFRARQHIATIQEIFPTGHLKRNGPWARNEMPFLKRAGKPPERSRRNLRDTGGEKNVRNPGMASGKKPCARRDVLRSCPHSGDRAAAAGCPRALKPRARSADRVRQIAASIRGPGFTGPVLSAGGNTGIAGAGPCADGAGDGHGQRCPASRWPISRMSSAPRILLLTRAWPNMRAGTRTCSGPGELRDPGFHPDRCRDAGG